ncbi:MAG: AtpZ/AtpI family protein [Myxococcota bacterium]|nr:AtpZ/AtpI family protein [Myxococcota bacterium]MDW8363380.1 AtpZ/AtpI family protein [Myxococcales bacterium]
MSLFGPESREQLRVAARIGAVSLEIGIGMLIGWFAGRWLDRELGTAPWLGHSGLLLGLVAGLRSLVRTIRRIRRDMERDGTGGSAP